jgi:hypothetical protein
VDLYAVGYWLAKHLRDPDNLRRYNQPKYQEHMQFLNGFADELCDWDWPDKDCTITQEGLMKGSQTPQEWLQKLTQYLTKAEREPRPKQPHQQYLARIAALLSTAPPAREQWLIRRQDHDAEYKKYWNWKQNADLKQRWRSIQIAVEKLRNDARAAVRYGGAVYGWRGRRLLVGIPFFVLLLWMGDWVFNRYPPLSNTVSAWEWTSQKVRSGIQNVSTAASEVRGVFANYFASGSSVQRLLEAFPQHPGAVAKARLHAGGADKPQSQFFVGDRFNFTVTNPLKQDAYLTVFAADSEDEQAQRLVAVMRNQSIAARATISFPDIQEQDDSWQIKGPIGKVRMVALLTPSRISWPVGQGSATQGTGAITVPSFKGEADITALFNCAAASPGDAQACEYARQNFAVSPVVTYEVVEATKPKAAAAVPLPSSTAQAPAAVRPAPAASPKPVAMIDGYEILDDPVLGQASLARDPKNGLIWQRCSVGQEWDGHSCMGVAKKFGFDTAQKQAYSDWRVPKVRELASLVSCNKGRWSDLADIGDGGSRIPNDCRDSVFTRPTITSIAVFPNTEGMYCTSSPAKKYRGGWWGVDFDIGAVYFYGCHSERYFHVRLVR